MSPISPPNKHRPWLPDKNKKEHQGRKQRSKEYNTSRWQKTRRAHLIANPLCVMCTSEGITKAASIVDHKMPVNSGGSFYDTSNHQGLCEHHHAVKSAQERHSG